MAIGGSGRIVIEMDPGLKRRLHSALAARGMTLKLWFMSQAEEFLSNAAQPSLPFAQPPQAPPAQGESSGQP
jgi:hypothetical protein